MITCRPILGTEAEAYLKLLCRVFELDFDRAQGVFFSEPLFEIERKWALFEDDVIKCVLSTVPLEFGWGRAYGVAGVATEVTEQGRGLASTLLKAVHASARQRGEGVGMLFAQKPTVYERVGYRTVDHVIEGELNVAIDPKVGDELVPTTDVRAIYHAWSHAEPHRLRRDAKRWSYWQWYLRMCVAWQGGYVCMEGNMVREWLGQEGAFPQALIQPAKFVGLESMAQRYGVPVANPKRTMELMAWDLEHPVEFFMTDQF